MSSPSRIDQRARTLTLAFVLMLSGCSDLYYDRRETIALGADDHQASNQVEQMIDPWPRYVGNKNLAFNGERIQAAVDRYRRNCVIPPYSTQTTSVLAQQQQQQQSAAAGCNKQILQGTPVAPVQSAN
jgi:hypothetical protein